MIEVFIEDKQCTMNSTEFYIICIFSQTNWPKPFYYTTITPNKYIWSDKKLNKRKVGLFGQEKKGECSIIKYYLDI
jgi:hypothetical protein